MPMTAAIAPIAMGGLLLFGLAILGGGLYIAALGVGRIRTAGRLHEAGSIPLGRVSDADGLVEFEGTARVADETLEAPLSGSPSLAYAIRSRTHDESDGDWRLDGGAAASVTFAVEDGDDRVIVDPANATVSLSGWDATGTEWIDRADLSSSVLDRLESLGLHAPDGGSDERAVAGSVDDGTRQVRERRLEPGDDVRVFGGSVVDSGNTGGTSESVTVSGGDWFEITAGAESSVGRDRRRSGAMYVAFGGLLAVPGLGFTLAGIAGLLSTVGL